jgi:anti-sigma B factor antagonist
MITEPALHPSSLELPFGAAPPLLDVRLRRSACTIVVDLIGDLDLSTAPELWETLAAILLAEDEEVDTVAIDLSRLNYTDSAGLSCFVMVHKRCAESGIKFQLLQPDVFLQRLFEITGLDHLFDVV